MNTVYFPPLQRELQTLRRENDEVQEMLGHVSGQAFKIHDKNLALSAEVEELKRTRDEVRRVNALQQESLNQLKQEKAKDKQTIKSLRFEMSKRKEELKRANEETAEGREEVTRANEETAKWKQNAQAWAVRARANDKTCAEWKEIAEGAKARAAVLEQEKNQTEERGEEYETEDEEEAELEEVEEEVEVQEAVEETWLEKTKRLNAKIERGLAELAGGRVTIFNQAVDAGKEVQGPEDEDEAEEEYSEDEVEGEEGDEDGVGDEDGDEEEGEEDAVEEEDLEEEDDAEDDGAEDQAAAGIPNFKRPFTSLLPSPIEKDALGFEPRLPLSSGRVLRSSGQLLGGTIGVQVCLLPPKAMPADR